MRAPWMDVGVAQMGAHGWKELMHLFGSKGGGEWARMRECETAGGGAGAVDRLHRVNSQ
jgi:hypothetical protein